MTTSRAGGWFRPGSRSLIIALVAAVSIAAVLSAVTWLRGTPTSTSDIGPSPARSSGPTPSAGSSVTSAGDPTRTDPAGQGAVPIGVWAGDRMVLTVTRSGATAEFECASGAVEGPLRVDASGRFDASGSYRAQSGGPAQPGTQQPRALRAKYRGTARGTEMDISVVLIDTGTTHGPFHLKLGGRSALERCL